MSSRGANHHRLQLADTPEQPLNQRLQRPGTRPVKIISGSDLRTGSNNATSINQLNSNRQRP